MRLIQKPVFTFILCIALGTIIFTSSAGLTKDRTAIQRIGAEEARAKVQDGKAVLVCSYDDGKCKDILLEGAMLHSTFESKVSSFPKDQEIIFYCS